MRISGGGKDFEETHFLRILHPNQDINKICRRMSKSFLLFNLFIYKELRLRGFCVDVGMVEVRTTKERKQLEVDFVANMADRRYYIQSAFAMHHSISPLLLDFLKLQKELELGR